MIALMRTIGCGNEDHVLSSEEGLLVRSRSREMLEVATEVAPVLPLWGNSEKIAVAIEASRTLPLPADVKMPDNEYVIKCVLLKNCRRIQRDVVHGRKALTLPRVRGWSLSEGT